MKKKILFGAFVVSLLAVSLFVVLSPTLARNQKNNLAFRGDGGYIQLSLLSNASAPATGTPNHPTLMVIAPLDYGRGSPNGPADELLIQIWQPVTNRYEIVADVTDNAANAEFYKVAWNNTYVWLPLGPPIFPVSTVVSPNVIQVQPKELEIWVDNDCGSRTLWVNLTVPIQIKLPFYNATGQFSDQSFTLPPMTMMFKATSGKFNDDFTTPLVGFPGASGYTLEHRGYAEFATARVRIQGWMAGYVEQTGHVLWSLTDTWVPP